MRIGIVGAGVVGGATAQAFAGHVDEVRVYDSNPLRCTATLAETLDTDLVFICLPTPQKEGSLECDTQYLDKFFTNVLNNGAGDENFVIKSTVPIGYTRKARERFGLPNLVHSPEFLTARTAVEDAANPTRNIIGSNCEGSFTANDCCVKLMELYQWRWGRGWSDKESEYSCDPVPTYLMSSDESEAVKLFQNSFSAVKIACFNEFRCLADKLGMDWQRVLDALLAGGWINPMHTQVPGPDGKRGFGGSCLPKDLANLIQCTYDANVNEHGVKDTANALVIQSALLRNQVYDRKEEP